MKTLECPFCGAEGEYTHECSDCGEEITSEECLIYGGLCKYCGKNGDNSDTY